MDTNKHFAMLAFCVFMGFIAPPVAIVIFIILVIIEIFQSIMKKS